MLNINQLQIKRTIHNISQDEINKVSIRTILNHDFNLNCPIFQEESFTTIVHEMLQSWKYYVKNQKNFHLSDWLPILSSNKYTHFPHMTTWLLFCFYLYYMQLISCDCIFFNYFLSLFFAVANNLNFYLQQQTSEWFFCLLFYKWTSIYYMELLLIIHEFMNEN